MFDTTESIIANSALLTVCLAFPISTIAVFVFDVDRFLSARILSVIFTFGLFISVLSPFLFSGKSNNKNKKLEISVVRWMSVAAFIAFTWELCFLIFEKQIRLGRDNPLFYPWWSYIDTGDFRYAKEFSENILIFTLESLSVINGVLAFIGLFLKFKCDKKETKHLRVLSLMLFTWNAVHHLVTTSIYYLSEILEGMSNVNTSSTFDVVFIFIGANIAWIVFPFFVLKYVYNEFVKRI